MEDENLISKTLSWAICGLTMVAFLVPGYFVQGLVFT